MAVEEFTLARSGVSHDEIVQEIDALLDVPAAGEGDPELLQRQRIAEENRVATEKLLGLMGMAREEFER